MRLFIVRHAEPDYEKDGLTPQGHRESQALCRRMESLRPDRLYVSPLGRARATCRYTEEALGKTAEVLDWVKERSDWREEVPPWGLRVAWDIPGEVIREKVPPPLYQDWPDLAPLKGKGYLERYESLRRESDLFLEGLGYRREGGRYRILRSNREKVAVFCHGGFGLTWLAHLLEMPLALVWSGFWLAPSSITTVLFDEASTDWAIPRCVGLCDLSHLYLDRIPVSTHGLRDNLE